MPAGPRKSVSRYWVVLSSLLVPTLPVTAQWHGKTVGRFGFDAPIDSTLFEINPQGIKPKHDTGVQLDFWELSPPFVIEDASNDETTFRLHNRALSPLRMRVSHWSPSIELYFPQGLGLRWKAQKPPFLSWSEGSVGSRVPMPPSRWALLSSPELGIPILISFPDSQASIRVSGEPGNWVIRSNVEFKGWVRLTTPLGLKPVRTSDARTLGALVKRVSQLANYWHGRIPKVTGFKAVDGADGVNALWEFDAPGAAVPMPIVYAGSGGYSTRQRSPVDGLTQKLLGMPTHYLSTKEMQVFFPMAPSVKGRLVSGLPAPAPKLPDMLHVPDLVEIGLKAIAEPAASTYAPFAAGAAADFASRWPEITEPISNLKLAYDSKGKGMAVTAAYSLMAAASKDASGIEQDYFDQCFATWDMRTFMPAFDKGASRRRTSAILAVALWISGTPRDRALAGMVQCGLAAERGANSKLQLLEVLPEQRRAIFGPKEPANPLRAALDGQVEVSNRTPIKLTKQGNFFRAEWSSSSWIEFKSTTRIKLVETVNVNDFNLLPGALTLRIKGSGKGTSLAILSGTFQNTVNTDWKPFFRYGETVK